MNTQTREWLHIGNIRRLGYTWESIEDAMLDRDPFQDAVPCWQGEPCTCIPFAISISPNCKATTHTL